MQTAKTLIAWCTGHFVGFVMRRLIFLTLVLHTSSVRCRFLMFFYCFPIWAMSWEKLSLEVCEQVRLKLACSPTETSWSLEILDIESIGIVLSMKRITKTLIRLRGCAGWSASLIFAYGINKRGSFAVDFLIIALSHLSSNEINTYTITIVFI